MHRKSYEQLKKEAALVSLIPRFKYTQYRRVRDKYKYECKICDRILYLMPSKIQTGQGCPNCGRNRSSNAKRLDFSTVLERAKKIGLVPKFSRTQFDSAANPSKKSLPYRCSGCGTIIQSTAAALAKRRGCNRCGARVWEEVCRWYFENLTGYAFPTYRPFWLRNLQNNRMELDGYCKELNIAFEYQGMHHYGLVPPFTPTLASLRLRQTSDILKRDLCKKHKLDLIIIPTVYGKKVSPETLKAFIIKRLIKLNIQIPKGLIEEAPEDPRTLNIYSTSLDRHRAHLKQSYPHLKLRSKIFLGQSTKLEYECRLCKFRWYSTPQNILRGRGRCRRCENVELLTQKDVQNRLLRLGAILINGNYKKEATLTVKCKKSGHPYSGPLRNIERKYQNGCGDCVKDSEYNRRKNRAERILKNRNLLLVGEYKDVHTKTDVKCLRCGNLEFASIQSIRRRKTDCLKCLDASPNSKEGIMRRSKT